MSFSAPSIPPIQMPKLPPAIPPLSPVGVKPRPKPDQPTVIGAALTPAAGQRSQRSLIGGAPTQLGAG